MLIPSSRRLESILSACIERKKNLLLKNFALWGYKQKCFAKKAFCKEKGSECLHYVGHEWEAGVGYNSKEE